jgi:predicted nucleic acid-binding Zn ribbon protein
MPEAKGFGKRKITRSKEPVSLGSVIDGLMAEQTFSRGMPVASLASRWTDVVGDRLAEQTQPLALDAGVLTVGATNGAWASQVRFIAEEVKRRANQALGGEPVRLVTVIVRNRRSQG